MIPQRTTRVPIGNRERNVEIDDTLPRKFLDLT